MIQDVYKRKQTHVKYRDNLTVFEYPSFSKDIILYMLSWMEDILWMGIL